MIATTSSRGEVMAHLDRLYLFPDDKNNIEMTVFVDLKPAGEVQIKVKIPALLHSVLVDIAQKAADLYEAQMRGEILAEKHIEANP